MLYILTISISAFLLLQVQPVIAKIILPWFGGSASVWVTCLVFFQLVLLLGYVYAHLLIRYFRPKIQSQIHLSLLAISVLVLPILPKDAWKPLGSEDPAFRILGLLGFTVGLPYFLLSTTSPLLQAWYTRERGGALPYRLFAFSNAGSVLALLTYPIVVERLFSTRYQAFAWSVAYVGFCVFCALVALRVRSKGRMSERVETQPPPTWELQLLWIALAACASMLLFAVTNHLCQHVTAMPFVWVLPVSLYLLSFVLCFGGKGWYRRGLFLPLCAFALVIMIYGLSPIILNMSLALLVPLFSAGLFLCCMFCHGELVNLKPQPAHLTTFYLMCSLGGAMGGVFVALLAPRLFRSYFEFPIAIVACAVLVLLVLHRDSSTAVHKPQWQPAWLALLAFTAAHTLYLLVGERDYLKQARVMGRNFYGVLRVVDYQTPGLEGGVRWLEHGATQQGLQYLAPNRRQYPTAYYCPWSGVGLALHEAEKRSGLRIGVIGLGTGTLASYGRPGDHYSFYEINPLVIRLANTEFSFLKDSEARVDTVLGDARLILERQPPQGFDVLVVDAFLGSSIPIHLLTREAFILYFRHLKTGGVLAVDITNKYLDLEHIVQRATESLGKRAVVIHTREDYTNMVFAATWILISNRREFFDDVNIKDATTALHGRPNGRVWTDDYSDPLRILRLSF